MGNLAKYLVITLFLSVLLLATETSSNTGKPKSLNTGYENKMVTKKVVQVPVSQAKPAAKVIPKTTTAKAAPSLPTSRPVSFKGPTGKTLQTKPAYTPPPPVIRGRKPIIVIDPGHGGKDPGAIGKMGTREKDVTLRYSLALKASLERTGKYKVVMTRGNDKFIELNQRVNIARKAGGDVLLSIHADSMANKNTRGFSVYTISDTRKDREAGKLLARANREEVVRGANIRGESRDVQEAIIDFAQSSTKTVSDDFAATVAKHLGKKIQPLRRAQREGSLAVLTGSDIPSVLIELGYLSNEHEERLLKQKEHQDKIVNSITSAIDEYFTKFRMVF